MLPPTLLRWDSLNMLHLLVFLSMKMSTAQRVGKNSNMQEVGWSCTGPCQTGGGWARWPGGGGPRAPDRFANEDLDVLLVRPRHTRTHHSPATMTTTAATPAQIPMISPVLVPPPLSDRLAPLLLGGSGGGGAEGAEKAGAPVPTNMTLVLSTSTPA